MLDENKKSFTHRKKGNVIGWEEAGVRRFSVHCKVL